MLSKRYESTEVDRITWLHVPSGTHWSTKSERICGIGFWNGIFKKFGMEILRMSTTAFPQTHGFFSVSE